jgi:AcrR family transcriptional regulator
MDQKLETLITQVFMLFMRNGVKSMTMDDISRELSISKKTLYKHFVDKSDLVNQVMQFHIDSDKKLNEVFSRNSLNAIDEMFEIAKNTTNNIKEIHPSTYYDLQKYYPQAWNNFLAYKTEYVYSCIVSNMEKGIIEGLYRNSINIPIIAKIYVSRIDLCIDSSVFPPDKFTFKEVLVEMMRYHIRGIATDKGINYMSEKIKDFTI